MPFKDHFSDRASVYASHRPVYPPELVRFLASQCDRTNLAWDAGCGSGQLSVPLADAFDRVIATDASAEQIAHATPHRGIEYRATAAESSGLGDATVDLAVAAQAAHWFDLPAYYDEVRRVLRPRGVVALITYDLLEVNATIDALLRDFYHSLPWPPERLMVDDRYATLPFPFAEFAAPALFIESEWNVEQLLGYVHTWSGLRDVDPATFERDMRSRWGDGVRPVRWPIAMRIGRNE